jgi:general secretion pathway protein G
MTMHLNKKNPRRRTQGRASGFTMLEVLIAIALLAAVMTLLIVNLEKILGGGNKEVARIFVNETMNTPLMTYRVHMGSYSSTEEGIAALRVKPDEEAANWQGPYIDKEPKDPWGRPYQYAYPGENNTDSYDLWSWGPDGQESEDDIGNWEQAADDEGS